MFNEILSIFETSKVGWLHDLADRMNSTFTVYMLLLFSTLVTYKTYFILPIACYSSTSQSGLNFENFVTNYCWVNGTIFFSSNEKMPIDSEWNGYQHKVISYYPWIPIILIIQCLLFYLPKAMWKEYCVGKTGPDLETIINSSIKASEMPINSRNDSIKDIAGIIESLFYLQRDNRRGIISNVKRKVSQNFPFLVWGKRSGNNIFGVYMSIKLMYIANALGQCFLMVKVLHLKSYFDIINYLFFGHQSNETEYFPKVTYCSVQDVRTLGANNRYVAQCVLPINIFNEKVYFLLFIWISFLIALNITYCLKWLYVTAFHGVKRSFIKVYLKGRNIFKKIEEPLIDKFVVEFLRLDGIFLLKMIKINAGELITANLVEQLWIIYKNKYRNIDLSNAEGNGNFENLTLRLEPGEKKASMKSKHQEPSAPNKESFL